jgi:hypothetical protein
MKCAACAVFAAVLLVGLTVVVCTRSKAQQHPGQSAPAAAAASDQKPQHIIIDSAPGKDRLDKVYIGLTAALTIVATLTLIAVRYQAAKTREAVDATRDSVAAIKAQTELLKNSVAAAERSADAAYISAQAAMGVAIPTLKIHEFDFGADLNSETSLQCPRFSVVLKNHGDTPAFLRHWYVNFTTDASDANYGEGTIFDKCVVEPGGTYALSWNSIWPRPLISEEHAKAIVGREKCLIVYGYVCYDSVFDSIRRFEFSELLYDIYDECLGSSPTSGVLTVGRGRWLLKEKNEYVKSPNSN